jgi:AAA+ superfamily predicted ATPase
MDTFDSSKSIIIAASNHQYLLDPALWRRFDALIEFPLPGKTEREIYLQRLLNGVKFEGSLEYIAKNMSSLSYADISEQLKAFKKATSEAQTKNRNTL